MKSTTTIIVAAMVAAILLGSAQQAAELLLRKRKIGLKDTNEKGSQSLLSSRALQECNLPNEGGRIECESASGSSCADYEIEGCGPVYCMDESACEGATIRDSSVFCQEKSCGGAAIHSSNLTCSGFDSCLNARIYQSRVVCEGLAECYSVQFSASAVSCPQESSCDMSSFDKCSCCDGDPEFCPESLARCQVNGAISEEFCSTLSNGISCAALGNPICAIMPDSPSDTMTEIPTEATTASTVSAPLVPNEQEESLEPLTPKEPTTEIATEATTGNTASATLVPADEKGEIQWALWAPVIAAVVAAAGTVAAALINRQRKDAHLHSNTTEK